MAALFWKAVKVTLNGDLKVPGVVCVIRLSEIAKLKYATVYAVLKCYRISE